MDLLNYPEPVRLRIFSHFNSSELFFLSFCSTATREEVKKVIAHRKPECVADIMIKNELRGMRFVISSEGAPCCWRLSLDLPAGMKSHGKRFDLTIDGTVYHCCAGWSAAMGTAEIFLTKDSQKKTIPTFLCQYLTTLTAQPLEFFMLADVEFIQELPTLMNCVSTYTLFVDGESVKLADIYNLEKNWVTPESCEFEPLIVGQPRNQLKLVSCVKNLRVGKSSWLKRGHLMWFKGSTLFLLNSRLTAIDIIEFVKKWMKDPTPPPLEAILIGFAPHHQFDYMKILETFKPRAFDPSRRSANFVIKARFRCETFRSIDATDGMDIERPDKLLASFYRSPSRFMFLVWHNRFPKEE